MSFSKLDVLLSPVEFESLAERDLSSTCCVVFDVLRATSTMTVALANGANGILPCGTIDEAIAARAANPNDRTPTPLALYAAYVVMTIQGPGGD